MIGGVRLGLSPSGDLRLTASPPPPQLPCNIGDGIPYSANEAIESDRQDCLGGAAGVDQWGRSAHPRNGLEHADSFAFVQHSTALC